MGIIIDQSCPGSFNSDYAIEILRLCNSDELGIRAVLLFFFKHHDPKMHSVLFKPGSHLPGMPTHLVAGSTSLNRLRLVYQAEMPSRSSVVKELWLCYTVERWPLSSSGEAVLSRGDISAPVQRKPSSYHQSPRPGSDSGYAFCFRSLDIFLTN